VAGVRFLRKEDIDGLGNGKQAEAVDPGREMFLYAY
jgi:hypothetical protein